MRFFQAMTINATALTAQRLRLDLISANIANANTTRTPEGGPYRRKVPVFAENLAAADGARPGECGLLLCKTTLRPSAGCTSPGIPMRTGMVTYSIPMSTSSMRWST